MNDGQQDLTAAEIVDWARDLVEPALRIAVKRLPTEIADLAAYQFGWDQESGGDRSMLSALTLLSAAAVDGTVMSPVSTVSAVDGAVAIELVHNFALLRDDVLDDNRVRRHRPAAWTVFGIPAALLAGDALLALAVQTIAESDGPLAEHGTTCLGAALLALVDGQSADRDYACLATAACALGGYAAGATPERVNALRGFGEHLAGHVDSALTCLRSARPEPRAAKRLTCLADAVPYRDAVDGAFVG